MSSARCVFQLLCIGSKRAICYSICLDCYSFWFEWRYGLDGTDLHHNLGQQGFIRHVYFGFWSNLLVQPKQKIHSLLDGFTSSVCVLFSVVTCCVSPKKKHPTTNKNTSKQAARKHVCLYSRCSITSCSMSLVWFVFLCTCLLLWCILGLFVSPVLYCTKRLQHHIVGSGNKISVYMLNKHLYRFVQRYAYI